MKSPAQFQPPPGLQPVEVRYEHSQTLPALLSTYQAGRVVSVCSHRGELQLGFAHFDQAKGLTRTASGIPVGTWAAIWTLPVNREIAPHIKPEGEHDIGFLARSCHHSGPLMGYDLTQRCDPLWDSLSHNPRSEVPLESSPRNPRCLLEAGLWRADVFRALARIHRCLDKVPSWLPPPPATTG